MADWVAQTPQLSLLCAPLTHTTRWPLGNTQVGCLGVWQKELQAHKHTHKQAEITGPS